MTALGSLGRFDALGNKRPRSVPAVRLHRAFASAAMRLGDVAEAQRQVYAAQHELAQERPWPPVPNPRLDGMRSAGHVRSVFGRPQDEGVAA